MRADRTNEDRPRWGYVWLAVAVFCGAALILAGLFQLPRLIPALGVAPTPTLPLPPHPTAPAPAATRTVDEPSIQSVVAAADDTARVIRFELGAAVAPQQTIDEVLLWYDSEVGHRLKRFAGPFGAATTIVTRLEATSEGLTRPLTVTESLDYWWLVRDTAGSWARAGGTVDLGPALRSLVVTTTLPSPAVGFTWTMSKTEHFGFYFAPDTAAERDRFEIGELAETMLAVISDVLDLPFDERMDIYLVPRVFWQGGAAYGDKIQLISYLDRNYTAVETWSYFTHEGTHALAQDLRWPGVEGGPDGVLVEGLAVWASGGHYRQEPIDAWAANIVASNSYIPLAELRAGPFYDFQHETAYLESASFVNFLIARGGLERFKELYGRVTGDLERDNLIARELYDQDYAGLEAEWLDYLATVDPAPEQAEMWRLKVRSFDLMRRYQTEMDPEARTLPALPTSWTTDTLHVFMTRRSEPLNVVIETTLIAAQERIYGGDTAAAESLLDDVEAVLDAGGQLDRPSLTARREIVDLLAKHDRARLRGDDDAYRATVAAGSPLLAAEALEAALLPPLVEYRQEVVRLDVAADGSTASGLVMVHARLAWEDATFQEDGQLFGLSLVNTPAGWRLWAREPEAVELSPPPGTVEDQDE